MAKIPLFYLCTKNALGLCNNEDLEPISECQVLTRDGTCSPLVLSQMTRVLRFRLLGEPSGHNAIV
jgi:hypothetical protein